MNFIQQQLAKQDNKKNKKLHKGKNVNTKFTKQVTKNFKPMRAK